MRAGRCGGDASALSGRLLRTLATALLGLLLVTATPSGLARADPGTPGDPQPPTAVFNEDFGNTTGREPLPLGDYQGANPPGQSYTADPAWLNTGCNGSIVRGGLPDSPVAGGCVGNSWGGVRQLAWALGKLRGADDLEAFQNAALSSFTENTPGQGVVFATGADIQFDATNRFLVFSLDSVASNCGRDLAHPLLLFSIVNKAAATPLGDALDPCEGSFSVTAPGIGDLIGIGPLPVRGATLQSTEAFLYTGESFGLRLLNQEGSGNGNDSAIDNITVVDATPQLDQSFSPARLLVGETATLTITVTNTSDRAAKSGWRLVNNLPSGLAVAGTVSTTCGATEVSAEIDGRSVAVAGNLGTGESSCTVTVPVSSADVGTYDNEPDDFTTRVGLDAPAAASVRFVSDVPSLSIEKSADKPEDVDANGIDAGDTIDYAFAVVNTGSVTVTDIAVEDGLLSEGIDCDSTTLVGDDNTTCRGRYTLTDADVIRGEVVNSAAVTGRGPDGDLIRFSSNEVTVELEQSASLSIEKSAGEPADRNDNGLTDAGDTIDYTFAVRNTGEVTLDEVDVEDDLISTGISCAKTTLDPAEDTTCSGTYTISQPDVDSGSVDNTATAVGVTPTGTTVTSSTASTTTEIEETGRLSFRQTAGDPSDTDDNDQISAGDRIRYTFTVGNTGAVTVTDVAVADALLPDPAECGTTTLQPGDTTTCRGTYQITQDDVDDGSVTNIANATGTDPDGGVVISPEDSVETKTTAGTGLALVKRAGEPDDVNANSVTDRGDTLFYSFTVRNTGGVRLSGLAVSDRRLSGVTCADTLLDPGETTTCLAEDDYVITQADMDEGTVANQASATAEQPDGDVVRSAAATETTPVRVVRAVGLVQRLVPIEDVNGSGRDDAGDRMGFGFTVVNTGTVSLTDISVRDPLLDDSGVDVRCPSSGLPPGGTLTCTSDPYVITDADVRRGSVVSVATVTARTPAGDPLTSAASSIAVTLDESEAPTPDPTPAPPPGTTPPGSPGPPPGGSLPTQAPESLSLWVPALALLLLVPEAVLLIWRYRRNRLAAAAAAARREQPPEISVWMGR